jgi:hypothetical protein
MSTLLKSMETNRCDPLADALPASFSWAAAPAYIEKITSAAINPANMRLP